MTAASLAIKHLSLTLPTSSTPYSFIAKTHERFEATRQLFAKTTDAWKFTPTFHNADFGILIESQSPTTPKVAPNTYFLPKMDYLHASSPQKLEELNDIRYFLSLMPRGNETLEFLEGILFNPTGWLANGTATHLRSQCPNPKSL